MFVWIAFRRTIETVNTIILKTCNHFSVSTETEFLVAVSYTHLGLAFTATACSDDDDNSTVNPADIEYNSENAAGWHNYMRNVAALLKTCLLYTSRCV